MTHTPSAHPLEVGEMPLFNVDKLKSFLVGLGHPDPYFETSENTKKLNFQTVFWKLEIISNFKKCGKD